MEQNKIDAFCDYFDCKEDELLIDNYQIDYKKESYLVFDNSESEDEALKLAEDDVSYTLNHIKTHHSEILSFFDIAGFVENSANRDNIADYDGIEIYLGKGFYAYRIK